MTTSLESPAPTPPLKSGDDVYTPSGATARIIAIDHEAGEATVWWIDRDELARFRLKLLRRC
jgi:hypothetical protein